MTQYVHMGPLSSLQPRVLWRSLMGTDFAYSALDLFELQHGPLDLPYKDLLAKLKAEGYLDPLETQWFLTKKSVLYYDSVATELVL